MLILQDFEIYWTVIEKDGKELCSTPQLNVSNLNARPWWSGIFKQLHAHKYFGLTDS